MCGIFLGWKHGLKPVPRITDDGTIALLNSFDSSRKQITEELGGETVGSCPDQFFGAVIVNHQSNAIQIMLLVDGASVDHALFLSSPTERFASVSLVSRILEKIIERVVPDPTDNVFD